jgi:hypothetical protein
LFSEVRKFMRIPNTRPTFDLSAEDKRMILGAVIAAIALALLIIAAEAEAGRLSRIATVGFAASVLLEFRLIAQHYDLREGRRSELKLLPRAADLTPASPLDRWGLGAGAAGIGALALWSASGAARASFAYDVGFALFVGAVLYVFVLIKGSYDRDGG